MPLNKVKKMIEKMRSKYGWEFLFLGANMDAVSVAGSMGIDARRAATYRCDEAGTATNFKVLSQTIDYARACPTSAAFNAMMDEGEWKKEIK